MGTEKLDSSNFRLLLTFEIIVMCRVPHGYGFTRGFQAKVLTVTVMVPDFDTRRQTVPIPAVSRYCTYTLMGL
jgi:hypothetical protein